jgi:hypothetical protein
MARKDKYHNIVKQCLIDEGWKITDDPYYLEILTTTLEVDLGAERLIAATKENRRILIEIKSFIGLSRIADFYKALGQFNYYFLALEDDEPDRVLYLAIPEPAYLDLMREPLTQKTIDRFNLKLIIYDIAQKKITKWIE